MAGVGTWALSEVLEDKPAGGGNTVIAEVVHVDTTGTVWLSIAGGEEFPASSSAASVQPGDSVTVNIEGGRATISGNATDLPAPTTWVRGVESQAQQAGADAARAADAAKVAKDIAAEAQAVADATAQHFFSDDNGAHITDVTQDEWNEAVNDSFSDYDPTTKPYHNQLLNSLGILLRTALNNLVSITRSAIAFYDGEGNNPENITARFGSDGMQIGKSDGLHQVGDSASVTFYDGNDPVAYVSTDKFYAVNAEVEDAFYIGNYSIRHASDGKLVFGLRR